jgi:hypothetical protein
MQPKQIFTKFFKSKNFMTPHVLGYRTKGNFYFELSRGETINKEMYGVTVLEETNDKNDKKIGHKFFKQGKSECFFNKKDVEAFIRNYK